MDDGWLQHASEPKRLTAGPLSYWNPVPSQDGKTVFATGTTTRRELIRYDLTSHTFVPLYPGLSATDLTFSADGQWMACESRTPIIACGVAAAMGGATACSSPFPPASRLHPLHPPIVSGLSMEARRQGRLYGQHGRWYTPESERLHREVELTSLRMATSWFSMSPRTLGRLPKSSFLTSGPGKFRRCREDSCGRSGPPRESSSQPAAT